MLSCLGDPRGKGFMPTVVFMPRPRASVSGLGFRSVLHLGPIVCLLNWAVSPLPESALPAHSVGIRTTT